MITAQHLKKYMSAFVGTTLMAVSTPAAAAYPIIIVATNAKDVKWAVQGASVYLRNLDSFDAEAPGCCYNVWIDLTNDGGRAMFAAFLARNAAGQRVMFYLANDLTYPGKIAMVGDW